MRKYGFRKGKNFNKDSFFPGLEDRLLSYEEMNHIQKNIDPNNWINYEKDDSVMGMKVTHYIPKKTQRKKDIVAAHKRSAKKSERQLAKNLIKEELNEGNNFL